MDFMIGQILLTALNFAPTGTLACNGQVVSIAAYPALFGLFGKSYGGDGTSTFGLPNIAPVPTASGVTLTWIIVVDGAPWPSGMEAVLCELRVFPATPPANSTLDQSWLPCDGRLLQISGHEAMFALIGTTFGGDGVHSFAVPKLGLVPVGSGPSLAYWICSEGYFPPLNSGDSSLPTPGTNTFETYLGVVLQLPYVSSLTTGIDGLGLCLGQTLPIATWAAVFSLLGTRYGGNGVTTFVLPNKPAGADGVTYAMVVNGYFPPRS